MSPKAWTRSHVIAMRNRSVAAGNAVPSYRHPPRPIEPRWGHLMLSGIVAVLVIWAIWYALTSPSDSPLAVLALSLWTVALAAAVIKTRHRSYGLTDPILLMSGLLAVYTVPLQIQYAIQLVHNSAFDLIPLPVFFSGTELVRAAGTVALAMTVFVAFALLRPAPSRRRHTLPARNARREAADIAATYPLKMATALLVGAVFVNLYLIKTQGLHAVLGSSRGQYQLVPHVGGTTLLAAALINTAFAIAFVHVLAKRQPRRAKSVLYASITLALVVNFPNGNRRFLLFLVITFVVLGFRYGRWRVKPALVIAGVALYCLFALIGHTRQLYPQIIDGKATPSAIGTLIDQQFTPSWFLPSGNEFEGPYMALLYVVHTGERAPHPWSSYVGSVTNILPNSLSAGSGPPSGSFAKEITGRYPGVFQQGSGFAYLAVAEPLAAGGLPLVLVEFAVVGFGVRALGRRVRASEAAFFTYAIMGPELLNFVRSGSSPFNEWIIFGAVMVGIRLIAEYRISVIRPRRATTHRAASGQVPRLVSAPSAPTEDPPHLLPPHLLPPHLRLPVDVPMTGSLVQVANGMPWTLLPVTIAEPALAPKVAPSSLTGDISWPHLMRRLLTILPGSLARSGLQGLALLLAARLIGARGFGAFSAIFAASLLFTALLRMGGADLSLSELNEGRDRRHVAGSVLGASAVVAPGPVLLAVLILHILTGTPLDDVALIVAGTVMVGIAQEAYVGFLLKDGRMGAISGLEAFAGASVLVASLALLPFGRTLPHWSLFYFVACLVFTAVTLVLTTRASGGVRFSFSDVKRRLSLGGVIGLGRIAENGYINVDQAMLPAYVPLAQVGTYAVASGILSLGIVGQVGVVSTLRQQLVATASVGPEEFLTVYRQFRRLCLAITGPAILGCLVASVILNHLLGRGYRSLVAMGAALSIALVFRGLSTPLLWSLTALRAYRVRSRVHLYTLGINILLNLCILPIWGIGGAVFTTIASEAAVAFVAQRAFRKIDLPATVEEIRASYRHQQEDSAL